jgi:two-component system, NarL family, invasion response regulator UvrY
MILDISVPDGSGLDLLRESRLSHPKGRVLMLTMYPEHQYAIRALRGGAAGYLTKGNALDELTKAVRKILGGGRYVSSALAERLAAKSATERTACHTNACPHANIR